MYTSGSGAIGGFRWLPVIFVAHVLGSAEAFAFRTCDTENSQAYSAATQYVIGEFSFDEDTGLASGTQTIYNYSNLLESGFTECHVTYELSGSFTAGAGMFVLEAQRTNHSVACPVSLIESDYPAQRFYSLQIDFQPDGFAGVAFADNGDHFAAGNWTAGVATFKTPENCTIF